LKELPYTISLALRRVEKHAHTPARCLPMIDAQSRRPINWAFKSAPASNSHIPQSQPQVATNSLAIIE
jgi:hypothetical protein